MTIAAIQTKPCTAEDYLTAEVQSDMRNEYRNGEIIPMTGGTPAHNELISTLIFLLKSALRKQPYSIFVTDQRLWIPDRNIYTYPDVMVTPRPAELMPNRKDTVMNPLLLVEVLSASTEGYDRGDKFAAYRTIPTVQEYVLIAQDQPLVEQYVKQSESEWLFAETRGLEQGVTLRSVEVEIALADLYEAIELG
ncbi:MAG: Uma2 family endonuclease [Coleofasciculaceae cyanobacterium RL_1_1]|nr:Uma2 family endonuclease [Coleofasciculaceae cyanobacterium RL_1_1]